ncbi:MAG: hypothetical protein ACE5J9_02130 [Methanosarcinales archaeon]
MQNKLIAINVDDFASKGERIYLSLKNKLEPTHKDEIVAIDVDTGEYFLGKNTIEAVKKGRKKYPNKVFYTVKIGHKAVHSHK